MSCYLGHKEYSPSISSKLYIPSILAENYNECFRKVKILATYKLLIYIIPLTTISFISTWLGKITLCQLTEFLLLSLLRSLHKYFEADFCVLFISCSTEK